MNHVVRKSRFNTKKIFFTGFLSGFLFFIISLTTIVTGSYYYWNEAAKNATAFVSAPIAKDPSGQVQLYFPLEKFLAWRSTQNLQLHLLGNQVRVRMFRQPISSLPIKLTIDILGVPTVWHGYFMLKKVSGFVDHIPIPTMFLFSAIAAEGGRYGVRVNQKRDSLFIDRTFGTYQLKGYDTTSKDLIIIMPFSTVLKAARNQSLL